MDAYKCLLTKRDLRSYTSQPIDRGALLKILEAGRRSGSSRNRQPWRFIVVTEREALSRLARCGRFAGHLATAGAAVVIAVDGTRDLFDAGRCAQNLMLAGWSLGIASCPATLHHDAEARRALGVPDTVILATAIGFGHPNPRGRGRLERLALGIITGRGRKPLDALLHWNHYGNRARQDGPPPQ
ncbi:MAG: nitroreductase family protein [bacterium]